jgi:hypothetical protein
MCSKDGLLVFRLRLPEAARFSWPGERLLLLADARSLEDRLVDGELTAISSAMGMVSARLLPSGLLSARLAPADRAASRLHKRRQKGEGGAGHENQSVPYHLKTFVVAPAQTRASHSIGRRAQSQILWLLVQ